MEKILFSLLIFLNIKLSYSANDEFFIEAESLGFDLTNENDQYFHDICLNPKIIEKDVTLEYRRKYYFFPKNPNKKIEFQRPLRNNTKDCFRVNVSINNLLGTISTTLVVVFLFQCSSLIIALSNGISNIFENTPYNKFVKMNQKNKIINKNDTKQNYAKFIAEDKQEDNKEKGDNNNSDNNLQENNIDGSLNPFNIKNFNNNLEEEKEKESDKNYEINDDINFVGIIEIKNDKNDENKSEEKNNNEPIINKNIRKKNSEPCLNEDISINKKNEVKEVDMKELILNLDIKNNNNNLNMVTNRNNNGYNINNKNIFSNKESQKIKSKPSKDLEIMIKKENKDNDDNIKIFNSSKNLNLSENRKIQRSKINIPTKASAFLEYFGDCLEKAKEAFNIEQKAFTLFKIPYLYNISNKDTLDYYNEDNQSKLTKIINVKNYLLHTKIKYSLIIQGESVQLCTIKGKASELFWFLIQHSRSVICCRCSPIQKSKLVEFVKKNTKDLTLAIGDGENDVNMIKSAHIGIGIYGKEGAQAAYNSDYAFYEFKYLKRLLFANGRFILLRNSYLYNIFFSKNFIYTLQGLIFNFFILYSGTFFFDEYYDSMYNTFISIISLVTYSVLEEDIDIDFNKYGKKEKVMMSYLLPDMYKQARDTKPLNIIRYLVIAFLSLIIGLILFGFFNISFLSMIKNSEGKVATFYELIFYLYFSTVAILLFMIYLDTSLFNYLVIIFFFVQIFTDILFVVIMNNIDNDFQLSGLIPEVTNSPICFLAFIVICGFICVCFYILRRAELYFGLNISNLIKINKLEAIYIGKFYKKKINQMIRAIRGIVKFKKVRNEMKDIKHVDNINNYEYENLVDVKMKKMVRRCENNRNKKNK